MKSPVPCGRSIVLIGLMGCGKSTVGRELSRATGLPFLDTDLLIEEQVGMEIPRIFAERGESHFRALETTLLSYLRDHPSPRSSGIIATGGGIVLHPKNRFSPRPHQFLRAESLPSRGHHPATRQKLLRVKPRSQAHLPPPTKADGVGFEPTEGSPSAVFKTAAFNRSATHPSLGAKARRYCSELLSVAQV